MPDPVTTPTATPPATPPATTPAAPAFDPTQYWNLFQQYMQGQNQAMGSGNPITRGIPNGYAPLPLAANAGMFMQTPYNAQAQWLSAGASGGMNAYRNQMGTSPLMQRWLPENVRHGIMNSPMPQWNMPWQNMGHYAQYRAPGTPPGTTPPTNPPGGNQIPPMPQYTRGSFWQALTPEQRAMRGGADGNRDLLASLTPEQRVLQQQRRAYNDWRRQYGQGQQGQQSTPTPQPTPQPTQQQGGYYGMGYQNTMPGYGMQTFRPQYGINQFGGYNNFNPYQNLGMAWR